MPRLFSNEGDALRYRITAACGSGFLLFGYDQGVFGGLLSNRAFLKTFDYPSSTIQGQIVATYDIGCIIGTLLSIFIGDKIGRRRSILAGCVILILGGIIQTASYSLAPMIVGRVIAGVGNGMNTIAIPVWQSETAKPEHRGKLIVLQMVTNIFGIALTNWMNFGFTYIPDHPVSWRFPLAFQCFFALVTMSLVCVAPESPRWLVMRDRTGEAQAILARLAAKPENDASVAEQVGLLVASVHHEAAVQDAVTWREIFRNGEQQTLRRILLGAGTSVFQQIGGVNVIAYYLPVVLVRSFGMSDRLALILSAVDSMQLMFWGALAAFLIDRVGRRRLMIMGVACSGVCFTFVAIGLRYSGSNSENKSMSILAVVFIFLYYVFYGMSLLSIPFMYPAEINAQRMRNTGTSVATAVNWTCVYLVVVVTPVAIDTIGWKYYLIYGIFNFAFVPIAWYFYVETARLSLEQVDRLFQIKHEGGKDVSWKEATRLARMETPQTVEAKIEGIELSETSHCESIKGKS
ncbi:general substrate transporter [Thelonectria olida]|uniref:General substrate transporter n=1 Tax=Thelonectria olida TaxID=1576542 RepID=A0A9P8VY76_9HYPO|nr:general substrate transporter [Thelonectria olida]